MACGILSTLDLGPLPCSTDPLFFDDSMDLGENFLQLLEGTDFALVEELPSLPPLSFAGLGPADLNPAVETPTSASEASSLLPAPSSGAYACASLPVVLQPAVARGPSTRRRGSTLSPPPVPSMQHEEAGRTVTTAPALVGTLGQGPAHPTGHTTSNSSSPSNSSNPPASSSATPASTSKPAQQATSANTRSPRRAAAVSFVNTQRSKRQCPSPEPDGGDDDSDDDSDSENSNDAEEDAMHVDEPITTAAKASTNKRKAPEVDWRSITDPAERRRQRRLAKNRVTAARSRERKKSQWADMEGKMKGLEQENAQLRALLEAMSGEHQALKLQLDAIARGTLPVSSLASAASLKGSAAPQHTSGATAPASGTHSSTEPAVLVLIATLLLLCSVFPGDQASVSALVLGSSLPLLAAVALAQRQQQLAASAQALAQQQEQQQQQLMQQSLQKPSAGHAGKSAASQQPSSPTNSSSSTSSNCGAAAADLLWSSAASPPCASLTEGLLHLLLALRVLLARGATALHKAAQQAAAAACSGMRVGSSDSKGVLGLGVGLAKMAVGIKAELLM